MCLGTPPPSQGWGPSEPSWGLAWGAESKLEPTIAVNNSLRQQAPGKRGPAAQDPTAPTRPAPLPRAPLCLRTVSLVFKTLVLPSSRVVAALLSHSDFKYGRKVLFVLRTEVWGAPLLSVPPGPVPACPRLVPSSLQSLLSPWACPRSGAKTSPSSCFLRETQLASSPPPDSGLHLPSPEMTRGEKQPDSDEGQRRHKGVGWGYSRGFPPGAPPAQPGPFSSSAEPPPPGQGRHNSERREQTRSRGRKACNPGGSRALRTDQGPAAQWHLPDALQPSGGSAQRQTAQRRQQRPWAGFCLLMFGN